jgi:mono/diheme cytochrome c family protein
MRLCGVLLLAVIAGGLRSVPAAEPGQDGAVVENPFRGVMQDRSAASPEAVLFVEKCGMCHRQMGMGTVILARRMDRRVAMLEARNDLTVVLIETAVRHGIGNMPRIGRGELSDAQLTAVANYLTKRGRSVSKVARTEYYRASAPGTGDMASPSR